MRLPGSDLIGGVPEVSVTTVSFAEKHLRRLIEHHSGIPGKPLAKARTKEPAATSKADNGEAEAQAPSAAPVLAKSRPDPTAIPPGALTVTMKQAMSATGLGRTTVDKLCNSGKLNRVKVGGWSMTELANAAEVGVMTVNRFEAGRPVNVASINKITSALTAAGVTFISSGDVSPEGGEGARLTLPHSD